MRNIFISLLMVIVFSSCSKTDSKIDGSADPKLGIAVQNDHPILLLDYNDRSSEISEKSFGGKKLKCEKGIGVDCFDLGLYFHQKSSKDKSRKKAFLYFKKSCSTGYLSGCYNAGLLTLYNNMNAIQKPKCLPYFKKSCSRGHSKSCLLLGLVYYGVHNTKQQKVVRLDHKKALFYYRKACDLLSKNACAALSTMFLRGHGTVKNIADFKFFAKKACELQSGIGCWLIGAYLQQQNGNDLNSKIVEYYKRGCKYGGAMACANLGIAFLKGMFLTKDTARGLEYLKKACKLGDKKSCVYLKKTN